MSTRPLNYSSEARSDVWGRLTRQARRLAHREEPTVLSRLRARNGSRRGEIAENSASARPLGLRFSITVEFEDPNVDRDAHPEIAALVLPGIESNAKSWKDFGGRIIEFGDEDPRTMADGESL